MMILEKETNQVKISSREIAKATGKRHDNLMRSIIRMEPAWNKEVKQKNEAALTFEVGRYIDKNGQKRRHYLLTKEQALFVYTKYSDEARARVQMLWQDATQKLITQDNQSVDLNNRLFEKMLSIEEMISKISDKNETNETIGNDIKETLSNIKGLMIDNTEVINDLLKDKKSKDKKIAILEKKLDETHQKTLFLVDDYNRKKITTRKVKYQTHEYKKLTSEQRKECSKSDPFFRACQLRFMLFASHKLTMFKILRYLGYWQKTNVGNVLTDKGIKSGYWVQDIKTGVNKSTGDVYSYATMYWTPLGMSHFETHGSQYYYNYKLLAKHM